MKKVVTILVVILLVASLILLGGCGNGKMKMLTGRWKLATVGAANGSNQQEYPLPVVVDIYPNGTIEMFEQLFGTWTMDRDTFTFKSEDGTMTVSGAFKIEMVQDEQTGNTIPTLTVYPDSEDASYILKKVADLGPLESMLRAQTKAPAAPAPTSTTSK